MMFDKSKALDVDVLEGGELETLQPLPQRVETITAEIGIYKNQVAAGIIEIGRRLLEAKELLPHGQWRAWLHEKVEFSERAAQNYMRAAREVTNPQAYAELGATKVLQILSLPPIERQEFLDTAHEVDGESKTVTEMTTRELEQVIRERDAARERAEQLELQLESRQEAEEAKLKAARDEVAKLQQSIGDIKAKGDKLKDKAKKAEAAQALAEERVRQMAENPDIPAEAIEQAVAEAKAAAEAAAAAQVEEIRQRNEALEKQLLLADGVMAEFRVHFETIQDDWERLTGCVTRMDTDKQGKAITALLSLLGQMREALDDADAV